MKRTFGTVYHVGHLAADRADDSDLDARATRLMLAAEAGQVILYQTRTDDGFEYHSRVVKGA